MSWKTFHSRLCVKNLPNIYFFSVQVFHFMKLLRSCYCHCQGKILILFFKLLFGCSKANFVLLLRGQSHSPGVNYNAIIKSWPTGHWESLTRLGSAEPSQEPRGFESGTFQFHSQRLNPLGRSSLCIGFMVRYLICIKIAFLRYVTNPPL